MSRTLQVQRANQPGQYQIRLKGHLGPLGGVV